MPSTSASPRRRCSPRCATAPLPCPSAPSRRAARGPARSGVLVNGPQLAGTPPRVLASPRCSPPTPALPRCSAHRSPTSTNDAARHARAIRCTRDLVLSSGIFLSDVNAGACRRLPFPHYLFAGELDLNPPPHLPRLLGPVVVQQRHLSAIAAAAAAIAVATLTLIAAQAGVARARGRWQREPVLAQSLDLGVQFHGVPERHTHRANVAQRQRHQRRPVDEVLRKGVRVLPALRNRNRKRRPPPAGPAVVAAASSAPERAVQEPSAHFRHGPQLDRP